MQNIPLKDRLERNPDWFDVHGAPQAPTLLLVHGSTLTRQSWKPQVDMLQEKYRIINPDLPGHGTLADFPFTMAGAIRTLVAAVEMNHVQHMLLVGASLGGHVATLYASLHPEHTAGLVISGASMNFHGLVGGWTRLVGKLMPRLFSPTRLQQTAEQSMRKKWPADIVEGLLKAGLYPAGAFQSFRELPDYDFKTLLQKVQAPVLILNGELDRPNRKQEQEFAAAAKQAQIKIIDGAGHACAIEKPGAFNQAVLTFAKQVFN